MLFTKNSEYYALRFVLLTWHAPFAKNLANMDAIGGPP